MAKAVIALVRWLAVGGAVLGTVAAQCRLTAANPPISDPAQEVSAQVLAVGLGAIAADRVQVQLSLRLTSGKGATVSNLRFADLRLNGLPVYADALPGPLQLKGHQPLDLPPLAVSIYFRDLDTLTPLHDLVQSGQAQIAGRVTMDAHLNTLETIALATGHVTVASDFQNTLSFSVPGPALLRSATVFALDHAEQLWRAAAASGESLLAADSAERRQWIGEYGPRLGRLETDFTLADKSGQSQSYSCQSLAFRLDARTWVALKQAVAPWLYDLDAATAMQHGHLALQPAGYKLQVAAAGDDATAAVPLTLLRQGADHPHAVYVPIGGGRPVRIQLEDTASADNLALLQQPPAADAGSAPAPLPLASTAATPPTELASFRVAADGSPVLVILPVTVAAGVVQLGAPVEAGSWGAPLFSAAGLVGMVQDEHSGLALAAPLQALGYRPQP